METKVYLIRHGETEWNRLRRIQGHSDTALSERGVRQAEQLAAYLSKRPIHAIYSSDLKRAMETARLLGEAAGTPVQPLSALRERCYGEWEGLTYEEIRQRYQVSGPFEAGYGIEPFASMQRRALDCLTSLAIAHPGQQIAVVSHGGYINAFLNLITAGKQGTGVTRIDNTGVTVLRYADQLWEAVTVNDTTHLHPSLL